MTKRNADSMSGWSQVVPAPPGSHAWTRCAGCYALAPRSPVTSRPTGPWQPVGGGGPKRLAWRGAFL
jgi:hypothetical protein